MIIRDLISLLLGIPAFWLVLRYNMHMFQLNTYMNNEQREWLRRNSHLQWILNFAVVLGIIRLAGRAFISAPWLGLAGDILISAMLLFRKSDAKETILLDHPTKIGLVAFDRGKK